MPLLSSNRSAQSPPLCSTMNFNNLLQLPTYGNLRSTDLGIFQQAYETKLIAVINSASPKIPPSVTLQTDRPSTPNLQKHPHNQTSNQGDANEIPSHSSRNERRMEKRRIDKDYDLEPVGFPTGHQTIRNFHLPTYRGQKSQSPTLLFV